MKKIWSFLLLMFVLFSCQEFGVKSSDEKVWVYLEVGIDEKNTKDYIYGQILKTDLDNFSAKSNTEKLFNITNVRIIGNDSIVKDISLNSNETGTYYYKISKIKYLEVLKKDPINLKTGFIQR